MRACSSGRVFGGRCRRLRRWFTGSRSGSICCGQDAHPGRDAVTTKPPSRKKNCSFKEVQSREFRRKSPQRRDGKSRLSFSARLLLGFGAATGTITIRAQIPRENPAVENLTAEGAQACAPARKKELADPPAGKY